MRAGDVGLGVVDDVSAIAESESWKSLDEDELALLRAAARVSRSVGIAELSIAISVNIRDESWDQSLNS